MRGFAMTVRREVYLEAAIQYLAWALENIEKTDNPKAASHARLALDALRKVTRLSGDKADEKST
jgi:hypothetical protein